MDIRPTGAPLQHISDFGDSAVSAAELSAARTAPAPVQTAAAVQQPQAVPNAAQLAQTLKSINKAMADLSLGLEFVVDDDSHQTIVKVIDQETKEVIRQLPSAETLRIAKALDQSQAVLLRQTA